MTIRTPQGGYFLAPEFHMWPDVQAAGPYALGTYISVGIWAAGYHWEAPLAPGLVRCFGSTRAAARQLVRVGLWNETKDGYEPVTLAQLQVRRGYRGTVMLVSRLLPGSPPGCRAGVAAIGAWALAASWSLTTFKPGFITWQAVKRLGITRQVSALCEQGRFGSLWKRVPGGYQMSDGYHPLEAWWQVARDDERVPIPDELRKHVYERDGYRCVRCGAAEDLAVDHIYPWSRGGPDTLDNLQALCKPCNSSKGARVG